MRRDAPIVGAGEFASACPGAGWIWTAAIPASRRSCRRLMEGCSRGVGPFTPRPLTDAAKDGGPALLLPPPSVPLAVTGDFADPGGSFPGMTATAFDGGLSPSMAQSDTWDPAPNSSSIVASKTGPPGPALATAAASSEGCSALEDVGPPMGLGELPAAGATDDATPLLPLADLDRRPVSSCRPLPSDKSPSATSLPCPSSSSGDTQKSMSSACIGD